MAKKRAGEFGGAAMEYILVTVFAVVLSVAALRVIADVVDDQLDRLADKTGVTRDESPWFEP